MRRIMLFLLLLLASTIAVAAQPAPQSSPVWIDAPPALPKGLKVSIVAGDPGKPGPFTILVKLPANTTIPPHTHPTTENIMALSGEFFAAMGETLDTSKRERVAPGATVSMGANMAHFAFSGDAETVIQISAEGPFEITYINPDDDPRRNVAAPART